MAQGSDLFIVGESTKATVVTLDTTNGDVTFNGTIEDDAGNTMPDDGGSSASLGGSLFCKGQNNVFLNGKNTYAGTTTVNGGVSIFEADNLGVGVLDLNGGTLIVNEKVTGSVTLDRMSSVTLTGNSTIVNDSTQDVIINSILSGSNSLTKGGIGNLILAGANTFSGGLNINGGTVSVSDPTYLSSGGINLGGGSLSTLTSMIITNPIGGSGGTFDDNGNNNTLSGSINTTGPITKNGNGTLTITNPGNGSNGGLIVNSGEVLAGSNDTLGGGLSLKNSATVSLQNYNQSQITDLTSDANSTLDLGSATLTASTTGNDIIGGIIQGSGQLVIEGTGTTTISHGDNPFSGGLMVNSGTVIGGADNAFGQGFLNINGGIVELIATSQNVTSLFGTGGTLNINGTLISNSNTADTLASLIEGSGLFNLYGLGSLTLTNGNNSFSGVTHIDQRTVIAGANNALGSGKITLTNGAILQLQNYNQAQITDLNSDVISTLDLGSATLTASTTENDVIGGIIQGSGGLVFGGNGTTTISNGNNPFSGGLTVDSGTVNAGANNAFGTGFLNIKGGLVDLIATSQNVTSLFGTGGTLNINGTLTSSSSTADTLASLIEGFGLFNIYGLGSLTLNNGNNSFSGVTHIDQRIVIAGANNALGRGKITLTNGANLQLQNHNQAQITDLTSDANSTLDLGSATLTASTTGNDVIGGIIQGSGGLVFGGNGTTTISNGNNPFSGGLTVDSGTVNAGANNAFGTGFLNIKGGLVKLQNYNQSHITDLNSNLGSTLDLGSATLIASTTGNDVIAGLIQGSGGLVFGGNGTTTISNGNNPFSGGLTVDSGTVNAGANNAFGTGFLNIKGGLVELQNYNQANITDLNSDVGSTLNLGTATLTASTTGNDVIAGIIQGTGGLVFGGNGTTTISNGNNPFSGGLTVNSGTVIAGANNAFGTGFLDINGGLVNLIATTQTITRLFGNGGTLNINNGSLISNSNIIDTLASLIEGSGTLNLYGTGSLTLTNGSNSFSGTTNINQRTVIAGANNTFGMGKINLTNGANLQLQNHNQANITDLNSDANSTIDLGSATLTASTTGNDVIDGTINGTGGLVFGGNGTTTISNGNNPFSGGLTVTSGTVIAGANNAFGQGFLNINGGLVELTSFPQTNITDLNSNLGSTLDLGTATLTATTTGNDTIAGIIQGSGGLVFGGNGTTTISNGNNPFSGGLTVNSGTVIAGANNAFGTGFLNIKGGLVELGNFPQTTIGDLNIAPGGILDLGTAGMIISHTGNNTIAGLIRNHNAPVTFSGIGSSTLSNENTFIGGFAITGGTVSATAVDALGKGSCRITGGILNVTANQNITDLSSTTYGTDGTDGIDGTPGTSGTLNLASGCVFTTTTTTNTKLATVITGDGLLDVRGTGQLTLEGNNTNTGGITINSGGSVSILSPSNLGFGPIILNNGGTLRSTSTSSMVLSNNFSILSGGGTIDGGGQDILVSGKLSGSGQLVTKGPGKFVATGDNSLFYGKIDYTNGTKLSVNSDQSLGKGELNFSDSIFAPNVPITVNNPIVLSPGHSANGLTVQDSGNSNSFNGPLSGAGNLTKNSGNGLLTLGSNSPTFTGSTTIDDGQLIVNGSIPNSPVTINNGASVGGSGQTGSLELKNGSTFNVIVNNVGELDQLTVNGGLIINSGVTLNISDSAYSAPLDPNSGLEVSICKS